MTALVPEHERLGTNHPAVGFKGRSHDSPFACTAPHRIPRATRPARTGDTPAAGAAASRHHVRRLRLGGLRGVRTPSDAGHPGGVARASPPGHSDASTPRPVTRPSARQAPSHAPPASPAHARLGGFACRSQPLTPDTMPQRRGVWA